MVTHTRALHLCSAFNPSKCTHTAVNTHTLWTHTQSSGQPLMLRHSGSSWGFGSLLKYTSVVVLKVKRALYIHSTHLQSLPDRNSNSQPFNYESDSLPLGHDFPRVYTRVCVCVCVYRRVCVCVQACVCTVYIYIYIYIHTHKRYICKHKLLFWMQLITINRLNMTLIYVTKDLYFK